MIYVKEFGGLYIVYQNLTIDFLHKHKVGEDRVMFRAPAPSFGTILFPFQRINCKIDPILLSVRFLPGFVPSAIPGFVGLPSYQPSPLVTPQTMPMSFTDRLLSTLMYIAIKKEVTISSYPHNHINFTLRNVLLHIIADIKQIFDVNLTRQVSFLFVLKFRSCQVL